MRYLNANREILLGLLDGSIDPRAKSRQAFDVNEVLSPRGELTFCWSEFDEVLGHSLPTAIVGSSPDIEDLIAWSATYLRNLSPISSYIRLIDANLMHQFNMNNSRIESIRSIQGAMLGAVVGEVCAQSRQIIPLDGISLAACYSTLSFAIFRAFRIGYSLDAIDEIQERWVRARRFLYQRSSNIDFGLALSAISRLIEGCERYAPQLYLFSQEHFDKSSINLEIIELLEPGVIHRYLSVIQEMQSLSAEDRVHLFEVAAHDAIRERRQEASLVVAVLAACCRPGNLSTMGLLSQFLDNAPDAPMWFGLVQGLIAGRDILGIANGLGVRIFRDLNQPEEIVSRPKADVQLEELIILSRSHNGVRPIRSEMKGRVVVDMLPGVSVIVPVPERRTDADSDRTRELFDHQRNNLDRIIGRRVDPTQSTDERISKLEEMLMNLSNQLSFVQNERIGTSDSVAKRRTRKSRSS